MTHAAPASERNDGPFTARTSRAIRLITRGEAFSSMAE
jgi:hypothetical protein